MIRKIDSLVIITTFWGLHLNGCLIENPDFVEDGGNSESSGDGDTDTDSDGDSDTDTDTDSDGDSDTDTDTDSDGDSDTDTDTDSDGDSDTDTDTDSDGDSDTDTDTDSDEDTGTSDMQIDTASDDIDVLCQETNNGIEICDRLDNDCDGETDNVIGIETDPQNCGGCENNCLTMPILWNEFGQKLPNHMETARCHTGHCEVETCKPGFADDKEFSYPDCNFYIKTLTTGIGNSCILFSNNAIKCWGDNEMGQLGRFTGANTSSPNAEYVDNFYLADGVTATNVSVGGNHVCALLSDNTIQCWGNNSSSQLGHEVLDDMNHLPRPVEGLTIPDGADVQKISLGEKHSCALLTNSTIQCWGENVRGELGRETVGRENDSNPEPIEGLSLSADVTIADISAGSHHNCALLSDNTIQCWGKDDLCQLGRSQGCGASSVDPEPVENFSLNDGVSILSITTGWAHTCALLSDNSIQCWGSNYFGELGRDTGKDTFNPNPEPVERLSLSAGITILAISSAPKSAHTCALLSDGTVQCWGINSRHQLGRETEKYSSVDPEPVKNFPLSNGKTILSVSTGYEHSCAVISDLSVYCWGDNEKNQLGTVLPDDATYTVSPVLVENLF